MFVQTDIRREITGNGSGLLLQGDSGMGIAALQDRFAKVQCVYMDPPFMTGEQFKRKRPYGENGWRKGSPAIEMPSYSDSFENRESYMAFLRGLIDQAWMLLKEDGVLLLHLDWRSIAHARLLCDEIFGERNFLNEIIWTYETGGRSKRFYSRKHDNILMYAKSKAYRFDITQVPTGSRANRSNHMLQKVDEEGRAYRSIRTGGKEYRYYDDDPVYPSDVWTDISHLQQRDPERTGYPTQKPIRLLDRLLRPVVQKGDIVADLCCGSGTAMAAAQKLGCEFVGVDKDATALHVAAARLEPGYVLDTEIASTPAQLQAEWDAVQRVFILSGYSSENELLKNADDPLAMVEQWRIGRIVDGTFVASQCFARSSHHPAIQPWMLAGNEPGDPAVSITDAAGERRIFLWWNE